MNNKKKKDDVQLMRIFLPCILLIMLIFFPLFIPLIFIVAILLSFHNHQYNRLDRGIKGEENTLQVLTQLPEDYRVFSNVIVSFNDRTAEIDHLILSNRGIVIVETKNWKGMISGYEEDSQWCQIKRSRKGNYYRKYMRNPVKQNRRQIYILSQFLKKNGIYCWIDGYIYILNDNVSTDSLVVLNSPEDLLNHIVASGKKNRLLENDINKIINFIHNPQIPS